MYENTKVDTNCSAKACLKPSRAIKAGERIYHSVKSARNYHEACAARQFSNKQANPSSLSPKNERRASNNGIPHALPDASIEERIVKRLHKAREMVRKEYALPADVEDYQLIPLVAECLRQIGSEHLSRIIQKNKEKNIQSIR